MVFLGSPSQSVAKRELEQGLCDSGHITCDVSPRCRKEGHPGRKECLQESQTRLSWSGKEALGMVSPRHQAVSWWKCHSQLNSHVPKADSVGVLGRWAAPSLVSEKDIIFHSLLIPALTCLSSFLFSLY